MGYINLPLSDPTTTANDPTTVAAAGAASRNRADEGFSPTSGFGAIGSGPAPTVPDYELLRVIGQGAYGEVWLARNILGEYRGVKVVWRRAFGSDARPFDREFEGIKRFEPISRSHPSQLAILHVGRNEELGCFYYVMELADAAEPLPREDGGLRRENGKDQALHPPSSTLDPRTYTPRTLRHVMRQWGALPAAECLEIVRALAGALAHLHGQGLLHRDIKPSNVIFVKGVPKLADIGLVIAIGGSRSFVGTEGYIPPEGPGTASADCYGLGKLLYEMCTGNDRNLWPEPAADLATRSDRKLLLELNAIVHRACAPDPHQRYASAQDMLAELQMLQRGQSVKKKRVRQRNWALAKKAGILATMTLFALLVLVRLFRADLESYPRSAIPKVNELVTQGNYCVQSLEDDRLDGAVVFFKQAIELDPTYLPAHWGLFRACHRRNLSSPRNPPELRRLAGKLKQLAPDSVESLLASAILKWNDWDFKGAMVDAQLASTRRGATQQAESGAHIYCGYFLYLTGKPTEALPELRIALRLDPSNPFIYQHLGNVQFAATNLDEAVKHYRDCLLLDRRYFGAYELIGRVYEERGDFTNAIQQFELYHQATGKYDARRKVFYQDLRQVVHQDGAKGYWSKGLEEALKDSPLDTYYIATLYARLGEKDTAYSWLKRACDEKSFNGGNLMFDRCWNRNDEEFKAIVRGIGLLE